MSVIAHDIFDGTIQKTGLWLRELMEELDWEDPHRASLALRSTLHALRDRLPVTEAAQLAAQLPMLLRGLYYEGWTPKGKPTRLRHLEDFLDVVRQHMPGEPPGSAARTVRAVFRVLSRHVTEGEITDVVRLLPNELRTLWP